MGESWMEELVAVLRDINQNLVRIGGVLVVLVIVLVLKDTNGNEALRSIKDKLEEIARAIRKF